MLRWAVGVLAGAGLLAAAALQAQVGLQKALFDDDVAPRWIYDDWDRATREAKAANRPILALLRCVP